MATLDRIDEANLINETDLRGALDSALKKANSMPHENSVRYQVAAVEGQELKAKEPVFLELVQGNIKTPIGITHFAKLTENFEEAKFVEVARTIKELAFSIFRAIQIHERVKSDPDVLITSAGTPLYKNNLKVEIRDTILYIEEKQITFNGKPLEARRLCGEEGLKFVRADNGDFQATDTTDQRLGKGMFFSKDTGEIHRG